jgi:hypothetical protein
LAGERRPHIDEQVDCKSYHASTGTKYLCLTSVHAAVASGECSAPGTAKELDQDRRRIPDQQRAKAFPVDLRLVAVPADGDGDDSRNGK